jgi:hypothetical protein
MPSAINGSGATTCAAMTARPLPLLNLRATHRQDSPGTARAMPLRPLIVRLQTTSAEGVGRHSCRKTMCGSYSASSDRRSPTEPLRQFHVIMRKRDTDVELNTRVLPIGSPSPERKGGLDAGGAVRGPTSGDQHHSNQTTAVPATIAGWIPTPSTAPKVSRRAAAASPRPTVAPSVPSVAGWRRIIRCTSCFVAPIAMRRPISSVG